MAFQDEAKIFKRRLVIAPKGAVVPTDLGIPVIGGEGPGQPDIIDKLHNGQTGLAIALVSPREMQMLVEYRDLIHCELFAIIGLVGPVPNTIWGQYANTMERVTPDGLREMAQALNNIHAEEGQPHREDATARAKQFRGFHGPIGVGSGTNSADDTGSDVV